jgi:hypothetical protein
MNMMKEGEKCRKIGVNWLEFWLQILVVRFLNM